MNTKNFRQLSTYQHICGALLLVLAIRAQYD